MLAQAEKSALKITKLKEHIGAEATGVDLREPLDAETHRRLNDAVIDHVVLVIRGQQFTAQQYQKAAENFGELMEDQNRRYVVDGVDRKSTRLNSSHRT